jgi:ketosteroid isomerase-like protein
MIRYSILTMLIFSVQIGFGQPDSKNLEKLTARTDTFFKSIETNNFTTLEELFTPDFSVEFPYGEGIIPGKVVSRDSAILFFKNGADFFRKIRFIIHTRHVDVSSRVVIYTWTADNEFKDGIREYHNQYTGFFYFDESGKIKRMVEYFNPLNLARYFGISDRLRLK